MEPLHGKRFTSLHASTIQLLDLLPDVAPEMRTELGKRRQFPSGARRRVVDFFDTDSLARLGAAVGGCRVEAAPDCGEEHSGCLAAPTVPDTEHVAVTERENVLCVGNGWSWFSEKGLLLRGETETPRSTAQKSVAGPTPRSTAQKSVAGPTPLSTAQKSVAGAAQKSVAGQQQGAGGGPPAPCPQVCSGPGPDSSQSPRPKDPGIETPLFPGPASSPYPENIFAFLRSMPERIARCLACVFRHQKLFGAVQNTVVLLYTLGMETGTPLMHAYPYFNTRKNAAEKPEKRPEYAGVWETRAPVLRPADAESAFVLARVVDCVYVHAGGRCVDGANPFLPPSSLSQLLLLNPLLGNLNATCVFVSEPDRFWYVAGITSRPASRASGDAAGDAGLIHGFSEERTLLRKPDNRLQMYAAQIARGFVQELGSHYGDAVILPWRHRLGRQSFILHCQERDAELNRGAGIRPNYAVREERREFFRNGPKVAAEGAKWALLDANARGCPTGVFSRGHCVGGAAPTARGVLPSPRNETRKLSETGTGGLSETGTSGLRGSVGKIPPFMWLTREGDMRGSCPHNRFGEGDGYWRWLP